MNKLEYIPGDLVMTNGVPLGTAKDVVYRVTASDPSRTLELDDGTVLKGFLCVENIEGAKFGEKGYLLGESCAWVKDIVPIPLTPEILEKSGWEKDDRGYCKSCIFLNKDDFGGWAVGIGEEYIRTIIFVHELQHLLLGLGNNSEMEV